MRLAAEVHFHATKNVSSVSGMHRLDQRVRGDGQIDIVIALHRLIEKRQTHGQHQGQHQKQLAAGSFYAGFHRSTGLRAAPTSSTLLVRVPCGALFTSCGSVSTS